MRSGLHNFSEPKGPGHSHVIHVHHRWKYEHFSSRFVSCHPCAGSTGPMLSHDCTSHVDCLHSCSENVSHSSFWYCSRTQYQTSPYSARHPAFVSVCAQLPVEFFTSHLFCEFPRSSCSDLLSPTCSVGLHYFSSLQRFLPLSACSSRALFLWVLFEHRTGSSGWDFVLHSHPIARHVPHMPCVPFSACPTCLWDLGIYIYICMYVCMYLCMYVCM